MIRVRFFQQKKINTVRPMWANVNGSYGLTYRFLQSEDFDGLIADKELRSDAEYIRTGEPVVDHDKACDNLQCDALVSDKSELQLDFSSGPYKGRTLNFQTVPWSKMSVYDVFAVGSESSFWHTCLKGTPRVSYIYYNFDAWTSMSDKKQCVPTKFLRHGEFFAAAEHSGMTYGGRSYKKMYNLHLFRSLRYKNEFFVLTVQGRPMDVSQGQPIHEGSATASVMYRDGSRVYLQANGTLGRNAYTIREPYVSDMKGMLSQLEAAFWPWVRDLRQPWNRSYDEPTTTFVGLSDEKKLRLVLQEARLFGNWCLASNDPYLGLDLSQEWGKLACECVGNVEKFDSNLIAYAKDLKEVGGTIRAIVELIRDPENPKRWASAWLSLRFADRLTIADSKELASALFELLKEQCGLLLGMERNAISTLRSRHRYYTDVAPKTGRSYHASVLTSYKADFSKLGADNSLMGIIRTAYEWDFYPTLGNLWDLIPYSFVVDWFIGIGGSLEAIDAQIQSRYYNWHKIVKSIRVEQIFSDLPEYEHITCQHGARILYQRFVGRRLDPIGYQPDVGLPSTINLVDGASMILQRIL